MRVSEYKLWGLGAIVSAILWVTLIFTKLSAVLAALAGLIVMTIFFFHWIKKLETVKNIRISYFIGVFTTMVVSKIADIVWWMSIGISFVSMWLVAFAILYVCTVRFNDEMVYRRDLRSIRW